MGIGLAESCEVAEPDRIDRAVHLFEEHWRRGAGRPDIREHWTGPGGEGDGPVSVLAALVKADLRCRYERDERPTAAEYLERFPALRDSGDRVLSLAYEEFCLREERGERPDASEFCARYASWKDSLESQLRYHRVLNGVMPPPPALRFPEPGEHFLHFLIGAELGRGGAGRVYQARDESLGGREVALKVSPDRGQEHKTMGRLTHPHIVEVHCVVYEVRDGVKLRGLCMPYLPGLPLDKVIDRIEPGPHLRRARVLLEAIRRESPPGAPEGPIWATFPRRGTYAEGVAWVVAALADALAHAHEQRVFHRDVKPANILLTLREGPQLLDFNLSHDPNSAIEAEAAARGGTLPYMAPEQLEAFLDPVRWGAVAEPADLYSLGMLLRELLTGRAPAVPDPLPPLPRAIRALLDQRRDYAPDLRRLNPRVPHALEAIAARCLEEDPARRYQKAADLAEDLRRFLDRRPLKHASNPSRRERLGNWRARHRGAIGTVAVVALFVAASLAGPRGAGPIESRPDFLEVVRALQRKDAAEALASLGRLDPSAQAAPVPSMYAAAAYALAGIDEQVDAALQRAWSSSDAEAQLLARGRSDPGFAALAESAAQRNLFEIRRFEPARRPAMYDSLERTFRLVLRLDPSRPGAYEGLANVDTGRRRYDSAHEILTREIETIKAPPGDVEARRSLAGARMTRARVSTLWAGSILALPGEIPPSREREIERHLAGARDDLRRGAEQIGADDPLRAFDLEGIRLGTLLTEAEFAHRKGDLDASDALLDQAGRLIDSLAPPPSDRVKAYRALREDFERRSRALRR